VLDGDQPIAQDGQIGGVAEAHAIDQMLDQVLADARCPIDHEATRAPNR